MAVKVSMVSLGCSKNLVDSERMLFKLRQHGYELVTEFGESDVAIVNTCGFIQSAKEEAIETILEIGKLKEEGTVKKLILTGCLTERYQQEAAAEFPEADAVIGISDTRDIVDILDQVLHNQRIVKFSSKMQAELTGDRIISTLPFFSYLKIAEGCSNCCTYCAIPMIRGKFRSVPMEDVLQEARKLADYGVTELNVIAQDTTRYGEDLSENGESLLPELLEKLCEIENLKWIRVLYCYPERISDQLIDVMAKQDKIVKYIDMPIQHCNDEILKRMNRRSTKQQIISVIQKLREKMPGIVLRTTLITGFPGESEEQFTELSEFVKEMKFERLGCFAYSQEDGTKAADFPDQIPEAIKNQRAEIIMEQQADLSAAYNAAQIDQVKTAVVEGFDQWAECYFGRTANDAPDIDGKIFFSSGKKLHSGEYVPVKITDVLDYDLLGEVISDESAE
ncbi:MAG: 30S ribosomal protein S12 methylthiotransferase RimO [Oscillospiraceae bacterium]|nr:30S ribosomal protein S12 methylthiotransferase RimO [Oscillospiraceae bacterium]